jgi:PAS domain S-box-containing protein
MSQSSSESPPEAVLVVSPLGTIEAADDGACRFFGYGREELIGMHGSFLVPSDWQPVTAVSLDRMRRGELVERGARIVRKDGRVVDVRVRARRLPEDRIELAMRSGGPAGSPSDRVHR